MEAREEALSAMSIAGRRCGDRLRTRGGNGRARCCRTARPPSISIVESFNYAVEGIIHVLRTHRNMRIHFVAAIVVLVLALWVGVTGSS